MHVSVFSSKHRLKEHRNYLNTQNFTGKKVLDKAARRKKTELEIRQEFDGTKSY